MANERATEGDAEEITCNLEDPALAVGALRLPEACSGLQFSDQDRAASLKYFAGLIARYTPRFNSASGPNEWLDTLCDFSSDFYDFVAKRVIEKLPRDWQSSVDAIDWLDQRVLRRVLAEFCCTLLVEHAWMKDIHLVGSSFRINWQVLWKKLAEQREARTFRQVVLWAECERAARAFHRGSAPRAFQYLGDDGKFVEARWWPGIRLWERLRERAAYWRAMALPESAIAPTDSTAAPSIHIGLTGYNKEIAAPLFRKEGQAWTVRFNGETRPVSHSVGMDYIADLLRQPRTEIEAAALERRVRGNVGRSTVDDEGVMIVPEAASMPALPMADAKTIRDVSAQLDRCKAELASLPQADTSNREVLRDDIRKLEDYLSAITDHRGNPRLEKGVTERSRTRVKHVISRAIHKIEKQHPALGSHLRKSIRTGTTLAYMPEELPDWQF